MESEQEPNGRGPVVEVEVGALVVAGSPRAAGVDLEHVESLAASETELPPIIVHRATMRVIDGVHRVRAARLRGAERIKVRFFDGDEAAAFVLAVSSNIAHGLPLSLADRKRAAERIIGSHPQWSDRRVAAVTGIAAGTVAEIRRRVPVEDAAVGAVRIGQDGRARPVDGSQGRKLAADLIRSDPGLSLRRIARAAGISPETARDVRNRLGRGESPLPSRTTGEGVRVKGPYPGRGLRTVVVQAPRPDRTVAVKRLKADPALRFNEAGRNLLMLLNLHLAGSVDWDKIVRNLPPHCVELVAGLAHECAEIWGDFASQVEHRRVSEKV